MSIHSFLHYEPKLGHDAFVHCSAQVIGRVFLDDKASVWPGAVIRGDVNSITIGEESNIQDLSVLHVSHCGPMLPEGASLNIGARVTIGHSVSLHGCTIGDECLIGIGSIVLDNAVLEPQVMLAAGSLVPPGARLESGWLYMGSPAKKARPLTKAEIAYFQYSAQHYVRLAQEYRVK